MEENADCSRLFSGSPIIGGWGAFLSPKDALPRGSISYTNFMSIFTDNPFRNNPVLEREVRGRLRLKRRGPAALWTAAPIAAVALYFYTRGLISLSHGLRQDARDLWGLFAYGALTLIVLLAPALSSTAITQEREQQTWDALAATKLTGAEIIGGKWLGRQLIPLLIVVIALPFFVGCAVRGQLPFGLVIATLAFLIVTSGFYGALGLLCSFGGKRSAGATATALTMTILLCLGTVVVSTVIDLLTSGGSRSSTSPVLWVNPFYALSALQSWFQPSSNFSGDESISTTNGLIAGVYFFLTLLALAGFLGLMVRRYTRAVRG